MIVPLRLPGPGRAADGGLASLGIVIRATSAIGAVVAAFVGMTLLEHHAGSIRRNVPSVFDRTGDAWLVVAVLTVLRGLASHAAARQPGRRRLLLYALIGVCHAATVAALVVAWGRVEAATVGAALASWPLACLTIACSTGDRSPALAAGPVMAPAVLTVLAGTVAAVATVLLVRAGFASSVDSQVVANVIGAVIGAASAAMLWSGVRELRAAGELARQPLGWLLLAHGLLAVASSAPAAWWGVPPPAITGALAVPGATALDALGLGAIELWAAYELLAATRRARLAAVIWASGALAACAAASSSLWAGSAVPLPLTALLVALIRPVGALPVAILRVRRWRR